MGSEGYTGTSPLVFYLNGQRRHLTNVQPETTLLDYLRRVEGLTGTKLGCGEGGCGACTVMLSEYKADEQKILHRAANACITPLCAVDSMVVTTVEGIGSRAEGLHPVQERLAKNHGSQCGFCTPGIVMSMYTLLRQKNEAGQPLSSHDIEDAFDGNLCRCTGYRPILEAFRTFASSCGGSSGSCPCKSSGGADSAQAPTTVMSNGCGASSAHSAAVGRCAERCSCASSNDTCPCDKPPNNVLGPKEVNSTFPQELIAQKPGSLCITGKQSVWYRPASLQELFDIKKIHPDAKIVVGNTELGIEAKFKNSKFPILISTAIVPELNSFEETDDALHIGAAVTLARIEQKLKQLIDSRIDTQTSSLAAIVDQLQWFAGRQIRNVAAVGGNIVTASPISDLNPIWVATDAKFVMINIHNAKTRQVAAADFFKAYRVVDMDPKDELLLKVVVPWNKEFEYTVAQKLARRKDDDIAIVSAGVRMCLAPPNTTQPFPDWTIQDVGLGYGGMAPKTVSAEKTKAFLLGKVVSAETLQGALKTMEEEFFLPKNVPGGMPEFRRTLALSFLYKGFVKIAHQVGVYVAAQGIPKPWRPSDKEASFVQEYIRPLSKGSQIYDQIPIDHKDKQVGKAINHLAAEMQCTGEAMYMDDIPIAKGELSSYFLMSTKPHAKILSIDKSQAEKIDGFVALITHKDVMGHNDIGPGVHDEEIFATEKVTCIGAVIGIVVANTVEAAKAAALAIKVEYEELPAVITIKQAVEQKSFAPNIPEHFIKSGNVDEAFEKGTNILEGECNIGGQEHFYLETNGTYAVPGEDDEITLFVSTQAVCKTQALVAHSLGIPSHKVVVRTKRLGGGFGGKETRNIFISCAVAVAAKKLKRPVRMFLDRDVDMAISGQRHNFKASYKVAYENDGKIVGVKAYCYNNMGNSLDLSMPVLDRCLFHIDNCYKYTNVDFRGRMCFTHTASNTAFRGFGGPQGMVIGENIIDHVARAVGKSPVEVRTLNMYEEGDVTPYGMTLEQTTFRQCWEDVLQSSEYEARKKAVDEFNANNRYKKRGISAVPTKFGISFTMRTMNQGAALVLVYIDGSVLISHGGVEMGQGLHTKICQVAAQAFGIPVDRVHVAETASDKVPNASPTAASASSDIYGMAVQNACDQIIERLKPVRAALGADAEWSSVTQKAWFDRINLSAMGFYKIPDLDQIDLGEDVKGNPFYYFTHGAAVSEVELDTLTGSLQVIRTDISMDVGRPLNPAIDVGQIEGAFVQGMGWSTMEEVVRGGEDCHPWIRPGQMFTQGPSTYKIPGFKDIPVDFRVKVMQDMPNHKPTIHFSKAIGEPPLFLGSAVFFAAKEACYAAREESLGPEQGKAHFALDLPATAERLRMACVDEISSKFADKNFKANIWI